MDTDTFAAYAAGFFDGEGWVRISVERGKDGASDNHHIGVYVTQRARHREVLDRLHAIYGGTVNVRDTQLRSETWAEQADWHIHTREQIEVFCAALLPYSIVKEKQLAIALEYVRGFEVAPHVRDDLGRIRGRSLSTTEIQRREQLRVALQVLNARGSDRLTKIVPPMRALQHRDRSQEVVKADTKTVSRGEARYNSVLTEESVRAIRAAYAAGDVKMEALALQYAVSPAAIRQVVKRVSWRHID